MTDTVADASPASSAEPATPDPVRYSISSGLVGWLAASGVSLPVLTILRAAPLLCVFAGSGLALAQESSSQAPTTAAGLPGGASSLTESHGDWTVSCRAQQQEQGGDRNCALAQQQTDDRGRRILALELRPTDEGATGILVLPFGLALQQGVAMRIDEEETVPDLPFRHACRTDAWCRSTWMKT